jgi:hypothetical protein
VKGHVTRPSLVLVAVLMLAACVSSASRVPIGQPQLDIVNSTTLTVRVEINGRRIGDYGPGSSVSLDLTPLPRLPWQVIAATAKGRVLTTFSVPAGDPYMTAQPEDESGGGGHSVRLELTCGTLLIWAGTVPPRGGAQGPAGTGDCSP